MKNTRWLVAGIVAALLTIGVTGAALAAIGHGWFGMQPASNSTGYNSMMGGNGNGGGMMGGGNRWMVPVGTPAVGVSQVAMTNHDTFSPSIIQVSVGTTVTWTNTDTDAHTVTFMPMMLGGSSGNVVAGTTFSRTFTSTGTYYYHCMYHQGMVGEVIVTG